MQEEVEHRSVTLIVNTGKFTGRVLKAAIAKYMAHRREKNRQKQTTDVIPHGKMTVKQLAEQNHGMSSFEMQKDDGSCASILLANGAPMKQIQEWMGHSDFSTTANIYAHLDYQSKITSAEAMLAGLGLKATGFNSLGT